jgi:hypothetical protein
MLPFWTVAKWTGSTPFVLTIDLPSPSRYSIHDLATRASVPTTRTVRFYIAQGLMDRPYGAKRGAWYEDRHLQQLLLIRRWFALRTYP